MRDLIASIFVGVAVVMYLLWVVGSPLTGMDSVRVTGAVVLALGFAVSATAVVPTFGELLRGNKVYLTVTSVIGLGALVAGILMLVGANGAALATVMGCMVTLWLITTIHHSMLPRITPEATSTKEMTRPAATV